MVREQRVCFDGSGAGIRCATLLAVELVLPVKLTLVCLCLQHVTKSEPAPPEPAPKPKKTTKSKSQRIETLNAPSSSTAPAGLSPGSDAEDSDAEDVPALTPAMRSFAALPPATPSLPPSATALPAKFHPARDLKSEAFDAALKFLGSNSSLLRESAGTTDALLVEAFNAQMRGESDWARKCTEKALMVQYCNKLGRDGVALFFKRCVVLLKELTLG